MDKKILKRSRIEGFEYFEIPEKRRSRPYGGISDSYFSKKFRTSSIEAVSKQMESFDEVEYLLDLDAERRGEL